MNCVGGGSYAKAAVARCLARSKMLPSWFKRLPIFSLLFTYIFVCSGLIVAVVLVLLSVVLWPVSKNAYRRLSTHLGYTVLGRKCIRKGGKEGEVEGRREGWKEERRKGGRKKGGREGERKRGRTATMVMSSEERRGG